VPGTEAVLVEDMVTLSLWAREQTPRVPTMKRSSLTAGVHYWPPLSRRGPCFSHILLLEREFKGVDFCLIRAMGVNNEQEAVISTDNDVWTKPRISILEDGPRTKELIL